LDREAADILITQVEQVKATSQLAEPGSKAHAVSVQPIVSKYETSLEDEPAVLFTTQGWPHKKICKPRKGNCHDDKYHNRGHL
jgi:hypothetical protein